MARSVFTTTILAAVLGCGPGAEVGQARTGVEPPDVFHLGVAGAPVALFGSEDEPQFEAVFQTLSDAGMDVFFPYFATRESADGIGATRHFEYFLFPGLGGDAQTFDCRGARNPFDAARGRLKILYPAFLFADDPSMPFNADTFRGLYARFKEDCLHGDESILAGLQNYDEPANNDVASLMFTLPPRPYRLQSVNDLAAVAREVSEAPLFMVEAALPAAPGLRDVPAFYRQRAIDTFWTSVDHVKDATDWYGFDVYPVDKLPLTLLGDYVDEGLRRAPGKRSIAVLQAFGSEDLDASQPGRRPSAAETRFMAYHAVIHGARSVVWWGGSTMDISSDDETWRAILAVSRELRDLAPFITAASHPLTLDSANMEGMARARGNEVVMAVGNREDAAGMVVASLPWTAGPFVVTSWPDGAEVMAGAGEAVSVGLALTGHGVSVLRVTPAP